MDCPCCSGIKYEQCCRPWHQGRAAPTALALMRSRYTAYALGNIDYIIATTHPRHAEICRPLEERKKEIEQFCKGTLFRKLEILEVSETAVTFRATLSEGGKVFFLSERSAFEKVNGRWYYLSGDTQCLN